MPRKCKVKGAIISNEWKWIYDWFGYDSTCPNDIETILEDANGEDVELDINSGGGDVYAGSEIYTLLKAYKGKTVGRVLGVAASAASVIGMGCTELHMSPTAQIMIHNASSRSSGDHRAMRHSADVLEGWNKSIANSYQLKTGMDQKALLDLMNKETWMGAKQAVELGFADSILFDQTNQLVAAQISLEGNEMIPVKILEKLRNSGLLQKDKISNQIQNNEKGDDLMSLEQIMQKLTAEEQKFITDGLTKAAQEAETLAKDKEGLQNKVKELENTITEMQNKEPSNQEPSEEELLANADPKIKEIVEAARRAEVEAKLALEQVQETQELKKFIDMAASFDKLSINAEEVGPVFKNFAKADAAGFEVLKNILTAANNAVSTGALFVNAGVSSAVSGSAWDKIQAKAKELMVADAQLSKADAIVKVMKQDTALYEEYRNEMDEEKISAE